MTPVPESLKPRVLVVDDDKVLLRAVKEILTRAGCEVTAVDDAVEGLSASAEPDLDVCVLDINMPNLNGMDLLREIKSRRANVEIILMTGHATIDSAMAAVRAGVYDYLPKPFDNIDVVVNAVRKACERKRLVERNRVLEGMLEAHQNFEELIGQGPRMQQVFRLIESVAASQATVLVRGESGTGKELVARALHRRSTRKERPFVAINCSALTETLLESELFGHVKGAFTGAFANKKGLFEAADGGTLFLDEIGDIPAATQVRLLRVLQEGELKRVGSNETVKVDVRVVAATNKDLEKAKNEGRFREDLYYRLNVIAIELPPLRDRPEDVPLLAHHFLRKYAAKMGNKVARIHPDALDLLVQNRWAGNVRELENAMERAVVLCRGEEVTPAELPLAAMKTRAAPEGDTASLSHLPYAQAKKLAVRAFERRYLASLLRKSNNNITGAARLAGLDRSNFRRLLRQFEVAKSNVVAVPAVERIDLEGADAEELDPKTLEVG